jgi:hypothetical protein
MPAQLPNTQGIHLTPNSVPPRVQHSQRVTTLRGVWQDKSAPSFARVATKQPAPPEKESRAHRTETKTIVFQKRSTTRAKLEHTTLWLHPLVKAELQRKAEQESLSVSSVGAALLEKAIQQDIHSQYSALIQPMMRQIIREELRAFGNRLVFFLMRIAFASEQSRILITNMLDRILRREGAAEGTFTRLVDQSNKMAQRNIIKKTEHMKSLLEEWEGSFKDEREGKNDG